MKTPRCSDLVLPSLFVLAGCSSTPTPEDPGPPVPESAGAPVPGTEPQAAATGDAQAPADEPANGPSGEEENGKKEKSYADVVPDDAETDEGLFLVHRVDEKLLFEIPNELFGRDFLLVSRIARVPADMVGGFIAAGHKAAEQVVRWERVGDRVLLRKVSFRNVADAEQPIYRSVVNNNFFPILAAFDVAAEGPPEPEEDEDASAAADPDSGSSDAEASAETAGVASEGGAAADEDAGAAEPVKTTVVLDVTSFFETDVRAISGLSSGVREAHEVKGLDKSRSFVNYARSFPQNVDVRHTLTFNASEPPSDSSAQTLSLEMHQSMILLPEEPMRPRFADHRVGWFTLERTNYGLDEQKSAQEVLLRRWRLEPVDPEAYARGELVEPVKPIVYYLDPATPAKWRPYVRQGVEDWQVAFEAAGFANAIRAEDAPTPEEDPEWSGEDVRYSMIRWAANTTRNAMGPSVSDPRSGEIIESDIVWYHNHMRSYRNRLLLETGAANPLARSLPVDDELLGEALRQVIAHEVGHALGLPHNMIASSSYPVESLRDPEFAREFGVSASIMDYARQNYVVQPGDGLEAADFIRQIGPYDRYSIEWGYRVIPEAATPEDEKPVLDAWILARADDPMYRFGDRSSVDPRSQTEDLGDDPVAASGYGLANLKRVAPKLIEWTAKPGEDWDDLEELYGELVGQYARYMGHVVTLVGGIYEDRKAGDQDGRVHRPVPGVEQRRAMEFLARHAFATPTWLLDAEILRRIGSGGEVERIGRVQARFLSQLLSPDRMQRLVETETEQGAGAFTVADLFEGVRAAVWTDAADPYARALQRAHLERLEWLMTADDVAGTDAGALARWQLKAIEERAAELQSSQPDLVAQAHFVDVRERIEAFLAGRPLAR